MPYLLVDAEAAATIRLGMVEWSDMGRDERLLRALTPVSEGGEAREIPDKPIGEALSWDESAKVVWKILKNCWRHGSKVGRLSECPEAVEAAAEKVRRTESLEQDKELAESMLRAAEEMMLGKRKGS